MEEKTYTIEEVRRLCSWAWDDGYDAGYTECYDEDSKKFEDWAKSNLPDED